MDISRLDWKHIADNQAGDDDRELDEWRTKIAAASQAPSYGRMISLAQEAEDRAFPAEDLVYAGMILQQHGLYGNALCSFRAATVRDDDNHKAWTSYGLMLERVGDFGQAASVLDGLLLRRFPAENEVREIAGRVQKSLWCRAWRGGRSVPERRSLAVRERALLLKAQELYGAAFEAKRRAEADDAYYSGVNVAAVFAILTKLTSPKPDISNGFRQQLEGVVTDVESVAKQALEAAKVGNKEPFWSAATLGDLAVLQDQRQTAEAWYKEAVTLPGTTAFSLDSVRQQLVIFRDLGLFEDAVDGSLKVLTKAISETAPQVPEGFDGFLTRSPTVIRILEDAKRFAGDDVPILITGETGTGKELIARALHDLSTRHAERLVCMNVAASTASLVHNDLFGHVKGAYTGAVNEREGIFGIADGGTLFLDEIGDCPPDLQATLLRVLQEGEIKHQGSDITEKVDVRLVSATNRNLRHEVREQRFRSDLLYRLGVPIHLPPLRERQGDIGFLAACFAAEESLRVGKRIERIGSDAMAALYAHP